MTWWKSVTFWAKRDRENVKCCGRKGGAIERREGSNRVDGNDIDNVSELRVDPRFVLGEEKDIRKFLDGMYVSEKRL